MGVHNINTAGGSESKRLRALGYLKLRVRFWYRSSRFEGEVGMITSKEAKN